MSYAATPPRFNEEDGEYEQMNERKAFSALPPPRSKRTRLKNLLRSNRQNFNRMNSSDSDTTNGEDDDEEESENYYNKSSNKRNSIELEEINAKKLSNPESLSIANKSVSISDTTHSQSESNIQKSVQFTSKSSRNRKLTCSIRTKNWHYVESKIISSKKEEENEEDEDRREKWAKLYNKSSASIKSDQARLYMSSTSTLPKLSDLIEKQQKTQFNEEEEEEQAEEEKQNKKSRMDTLHGLLENHKKAILTGSNRIQQKRKPIPDFFKQNIDLSDQEYSNSEFSCDELEDLVQDENLDDLLNYNSCTQEDEDQNLNSHEMKNAKSITQRFTSEPTTRRRSLTYESESLRKAVTKTKSEANGSKISSTDLIFSQNDKLSNQRSSFDATLILKPTILSTSIISPIPIRQEQFTKKKKRFWKKKSIFHTENDFIEIGKNIVNEIRIQSNAYQDLNEFLISIQQQSKILNHFSFLCKEDQKNLFFYQFEAPVSSENLITLPDDCLHIGYCNIFILLQSLLSDTDDLHFTSVFLLSYRSFLSRYELMELLISRAFTCPPSSKLGEFDPPMQGKVLQFICYWVEQCYLYDFYQDSHMMFMLSHLIHFLDTFDVRKNIVMKHIGNWVNFISFFNKIQNLFFFFNRKFKGKKIYELIRRKNQIIIRM